MIEGLVQLFLWQGLGELISKFLLPSIPGPVLGLLLLLAYLFIKGEAQLFVGDGGRYLSATFRSIICASVCWRSAVFARATTPRTRCFNRIDRQRRADHRRYGCGTQSVLVFLTQI
jgi:hypothetical protein